MTNAIRFGKLDTITISGDTTIIEHETIHDYTPTVRKTMTTLSVFPDSRKQVIAELLKLVDRLDHDDVSEIAFECGKRNNGSPYKMSVSWVSK